MNMAKRTALFVSLALLLFFAAGCLQNLGQSGNYGRDYTGSLQNFTFSDPKFIQECKLGECIALACSNSSSWFGFRTSYAGGNCTWIRNCTADKFAALINKTTTKNLFPRQFMIGQGYSFAEFGDANAWCGNRLDMAVHWLIGSNTTNYSAPDADRATCFLEKDVMPVYVLYSGSQNINVQQTRKIADSLKKAGPVIITTEMDFNASVPTAVDNITLQIDAIDAACANQRNDPARGDNIRCFVALGVRMGDYDGLKAVMDKLGPTGAKKVDLIAFGVNAHTVNLSGSNERNCNPDAALQQALKFARYSLYNYSKPTVIPYIMFDSSGPDANNSCNWTEERMVDGYATVFKLWLLPFQKAGVIGIAAYDFNSSQMGMGNPLQCNDCSLGKNANRMQAWFASCRSYKVLSAKYPAGDNMIVYSNGSGGTCDFNLNPMGILQMSYGSYANAATPPLTPPNVTAIRCDACVNENKTFPFSGIPPDSGVLGSLSSPATNFTYCRSVPALDYYASKRNIDPMLVRAIVMGESGFDPCSAAKVGESGFDAGCYPKGYDYVPDPEGVCHKADSKVAGTRYCALGLMQALEPPYTFWPSSVSPTGVAGPYYSGAPTDQLFLEAYNKGRSGLIAESKSECSYYYNPFNATHSACFGTYKFMKNYENARGVVQNNMALLGSPDSNTARGIAYYVALQFYRGYGGASAWMTDFGARYKYDEDYCAVDSHKSESGCVERETDKDCWGLKDFPKFVRECKFKKGLVPGNVQSDVAPYYGDYASRVLSIYRALEQGCGSSVASCPSWKTMRTLACANDPTKGTPSASASEGEQCIPLKN